ncbi:UNVERIFIED_CONTAM: hypothetical protein GTU68_007258 [Idotea baltica]|nr:hypothetical protein [Idotea baltica]
MVIALLNEFYIKMNYKFFYNEKPQNTI